MRKISNDLSGVNISGNGPGASINSGTPGPDTLVGTTGDDNLHGDGGDDTIDPLSGTDHVEGNDGIDTLILHYEGYHQGISTGAFTYVAGQGYSGFYGAPGFGSVDFTTIENFKIYGGDFADDVTVGDGNDLVSLGGSNDIVHLGLGTDFADGGGNIDGYGKSFAGLGNGVSVNLNTNAVSGTLSTVANFEYFAGVTGTSFNDTFLATQAAMDDTISGGDGGDILGPGLSGAGGDHVDGGLGNDTLVIDYSGYHQGIGTGGNTAFSGTLASGYSGAYDATGFSTVFFTSIERFNIIGGDFSDVFTTGDSNDVVSTGGSDDVVHLGRGTDAADGGGNNDGYGKSFSNLTADITVNLNTNTILNSASTVTGFEYFAGITGGSGNDTFLATQVQYDDTIDGGTGNDILGPGLSGAGGDHVTGGAGSDTLVIDYSGYHQGIGTGGNTAFSGSFAAGYDGAYDAAGFSTVFFTGIENFTITGGDFTDTFSTGDGNDVVSTNGSDDVVHLGKGIDQADGGGNVDGYGKDFSDIATGVGVNLGTGIVTGNASTATNFEYFAGITGGAGNDSFLSTQNARDDTIDGGAGNDILGPGLSAGGGDHVTGGAGNDTLVIDYSGYHNGIGTGGNTAFSGSLAAGYDGAFDAASFSVVFFTGIENFQITGGDFSDTFTTGDGNDVVSTGSSDDVVHLGKGIDQADGGGNIDGYGKDFSEVATGVSVNLGTGVVTGTTSTATNFEYFAGVTGGAGNDTFLSTLNGRDDTIDGGAGDDVIDAGISAGGGDLVMGGTGNDTLILNYAGYHNGLGSGGNTSFVADGNGGYSGWFDAASYSAVHFSSIENFQITGGDFSDVVTLGGGNNSFDGAGSNDTLILTGSSLGDYLFYDLGNGQIGVRDLSQMEGQGLTTIKNVETVRVNGVDTAVSSLTLQTAIVLSGSANSVNYSASDHGITVFAMGGDDVITGSNFDDYIVGGTGADRMKGLDGNDRYVIDNAGDVVIEGAGGGMDTVYSSVTFTLAGQELENLTLTGWGDIDGTGNSLANILNGNGGNNNLTGGAGIDTLNGMGGNDRLDGGLGADAMAGGAGDDTFIVDNFSDSASENASEGYDTVISDKTWTLGANIEALRLNGTDNNNATGNGLDNALTGNNGNNVINGGAGADAMVGEKGDDIYYVDNAGDTVVETTGEGTDKVVSSVTFTLAGQQVENLTLTGAGDINATGNSLANIITGNAGANVINGGAGADTMTGGAGNDTFTVDNAGDTVIEGSGGGTDLVNASVTFSLAGQFVENLTLTGTNAINGTGNSLANTITGNNAANTLNGGTGGDTLWGKGGADVFLFGLSSGADTISDFSAAQNDTINVNAYTHGTAHTAYIHQVGADTTIDLGGGNVITVLHTTATDAAFLSHIVW